MFFNVFLLDFCALRGEMTIFLYKDIKHFLGSDWSVRLGNNLKLSFEQIG